MLHQGVNFNSRRYTLKHAILFPCSQGYYSGGHPSMATQLTLMLRLRFADSMSKSNTNTVKVLPTEHYCTYTSLPFRSISTSAAGTGGVLPVGSSTIDKHSLRSWKTWVASYTSLSSWSSLESIALAHTLQHPLGLASYHSQCQSLKVNQCLSAPFFWISGPWCNGCG